MRKIIVLLFITLDGVVQAPGGPEEDPSDGFKYGGWSAPYSDEVSGKVMQKQMERADLLLGRKTFEIFAGYWPQHADYWPGVNEVTKYAFSNTIKKSDWQNVVFLTSVAEIEKLKNSDGGDIKIWGSSKLVQLLLKHDLVDEFWLNIHPVILGRGKKLFGDDAMPAAFELVESHSTPTGLIMANYKRGGEVKTGTVGA
ncbi:dihydrofolate reductase family protein [Mucilaginibacter sp.]|jgi:dihydrofolate reductase|uniref:dihydrofolate reductase family protein n=1 Tax=Mucilaginibacter sp. TaxID=1882438 RepID=UPI002B5904AF|nr:dihydrofolate reductase family protein [Mucilaginibacter sp.]HTI61613.1 dihydrofolate reductase family protein [Mucilaginibacter sp.]